MSKESTLVLIKPDGVNRALIGKVIDRLESTGLKIIGMKLILIDKDLASKHYEEHKEKPFFNDLIKFMTSGPCMVLALEKENAVESWRKAIGSTNPQEAEEGTIRKDFASNVQENAVHGSDSDENAQKEIAFFFLDSELLSN